jgi:hypothetical protein
LQPCPVDPWEWQSPAREEKIEVYKDAKIPTIENPLETKASIRNLGVADPSIMYSQKYSFN